VFNRLEQNQYTLSPSLLLYISKAKNYVFEHYQENVSVNDIAKHLKLSEGYLQNIFRSATGMSLISFLNHYRIEIAKELIIHKSLTLQETAKQIGIADPSYMSRLFRKITGITYSQFFSQYANRIFYKKI
jgi:two-component system response regulator YesN